MVTNTAFVALVLGAATLGCSLNSDRKDACNVPDDCLDGFACVNRRCEASQVDAGGQSDASGPGNGGEPTDAPSQEYGVVEPFTPSSNGVAAMNFTLLGTTAASGNLGCALVGNESGAPGGAAALVHAKVMIESGDRRCPDGIHAISNDPSSCLPHPVTGLLPRCALYRRWDASGNLVVQRPAIGGVITIHDVELGAMAHRCEVDLDLTFAGATSIRSTFSFEFNPFAPAEAFCVH